MLLWQRVNWRVPGADPALEPTAARRSPVGSTQVKRQNVRKALILVSFLLMPVTLYYMSPALVIMGAAAGIITGSFVVFGLQFVSSLLLGRAFCGWVCPAAGLQEACFAVTDRRARGGKLDWIKYLIWVPWIAIIVVTTVHAGGLRRIDFLYQTTGGISVAQPAAYWVFYTVVGLITVLALTAGRRAFCHYACWMAPFMVIGTAARNAVRWPALHLRSDRSKCIECKKCTRDCPMSLHVHEMVQAERMDNLECILCGTCVDGCPAEAIRYSFGAGS